MQKIKKVACKCANCGGEHTANWKGSPAYKAKFVSLQASKTATQRVKQRKWAPSEKITPGKTFTEVANAKFEQPVKQAVKQNCKQNLKATKQ